MSDLPDRIFLSMGGPWRPSERTVADRQLATRKMICMARDEPFDDELVKMARHDEAVFDDEDETTLAAKMVAMT